MAGHNVVGRRLQLRDGGTGCAGGIRLRVHGQVNHHRGVLMRRTAVAVIGFGCAIGVFAAAGTIPVSASAADRDQASGNVSGAGAPANAAEGVPADQAGSARSSEAGTAAASKLKTIEYDGYSITVPYSWQVFHLDTDPSQCVRYDINAVYLGNPGANQNCPSNLIGRAQTITIDATGVPAIPRAMYRRAAAAEGGLGTALPASSDARRIASGLATLSWLDQYSEQHEFQAAVADSDLSVTGTYGGDAGQVEIIIRGMHKLAVQPSGARAGTARKALTGAGSSARTHPIRAAGYPQSAVKLTSMATPTWKPRPRQSRRPHRNRGAHRSPPRRRRHPASTLTRA